MRYCTQKKKKKAEGLLQTTFWLNDGQKGNSVPGIVMMSDVVMRDPENKRKTHHFSA